MTLLHRFAYVLVTLAVGMSADVFAQAPLDSREQLNALLWQQQAVEYRATALQAYRLATAQLGRVRSNGLSAAVEQQRAGGFKSKRPAIVFDIDETVLDNTPFNAMLVRNGRGFDPGAWAQWVAAARAGPVPGAREFIAQARAARFRAVFITNRECNRDGGYDAQGHALDCPQKRATLDNLQGALGYRPADTDLLMRHEQHGRDDSDKQARRQEVARTHRIAMLIGDDLNDFIRRSDYVPENHGHHWGSGSGAPWIALANPIYGSWERVFPDLAQKYAGLAAWEAPPTLGTRLRLVTWNLEWLADPQRLDSAGFWSQCAAQGWPKGIKLLEDLPFCDVYKRDGILSASDYEQKKLIPLRQRLAEFAAQEIDVIAVQEASSPSALQAVLPAGYRVVCFTTRADAQNVGYAVREAAKLRTHCREIVALSQENNPVVPRPVRRGLEMKVDGPGEVPTRSVTLLNVHLKSSCPGGRLDSTTNANCATLQQQAPVLEAWIEEQAARAAPFAILGDWNRDLEAEIAGNFPARSDGSDPTGPLQPTMLRNLWPELNDLTPPASAMELAVVDRSAARATPKCHETLNQLALSLLLKAQLAPASLVNGRVPAALANRPAAASDHCPLQVDLRFR